MSSGDTDKEVPTPSPFRRQSPLGLLCAYAAWMLPAVLLLPTVAQGGRVDVRFVYLMAPVYELALVVFVTRYWYKMTWMEVGLPGKDIWRKVAVGVLLATAYLLISLVAARTGLEEGLGNLIDLWRESGLRFAGRLVVFPVVEELFFRGVAFRVFARRYDPHRAIVLTSFLFAASHLSFAALPWFFFVGFALGMFVQRSGSTLLAPMILHIALNTRYHMSF
jgi:membrane protease YdiL (CAAX protease family)